jgi:3'(2'), 5'-bisphosphate nucleotidase
MPYEAELEAALGAALDAGRLVLQHYEAFVRIPDAPADISTEADRAAQELILTRLIHEFPNDGLCAEEATACLTPERQSVRGRHWVVDPIDGTRGFARKNGEFSVMIAFVEGDRVAVGVVLEPAHDRCTYARRGGGCWVVERGQGPRSCRVSGISTVEAATLTRSHGKPGQGGGTADAVKAGRVLETYSAGVKLALVARGEADIYVNDYPNFHDWDVAAGHILVEEAGGTVSTLTGLPIVYGKQDAGQRMGLLASNGALHSAALCALRPCVGDGPG